MWPIIIYTVQVSKVFTYLKFWYINFLPYWFFVILQNVRNYFAFNFNHLYIFKCERFFSNKKINNNKLYEYVHRILKNNSLLLWLDSNLVHNNLIRYKAVTLLAVFLL